MEDPNLLLVKLNSLDKICLDRFWKKMNVYALTVSPKKMTEREEIDWIHAITHYFGLEYLFYFERDGTNRLHIHGVIRLGQNRIDCLNKIAYFRTLQKTIGFCKFSENPKKQWYGYMNKDYEDYIYKYMKNGKMELKTDTMLDDKYHNDEHALSCYEELDKMIDRLKDRRGVPNDDTGMEHDAARPVQQGVKDAIADCLERI